ncbi:aminoglycoside phosphotransferase [Shewanella sp. NFH-SH190041]|uniref:phosphotransferase enzyme family protein n=1 Tax=Shewanella sp. NFH-SH190041 TaxID=2950245 RepID=UPI0021C3745C|nr:aminoglycoside phosphotransferase family protein [Shewanella sp. NFH-SH190041]BDM66105.1 aminoglycoside phosphotransferase [Shewanella sp. NFH-SH190041]
MLSLIRQQILPHYGLAADSTHISPLGQGHINHTFLLRSRASGLEGTDSAAGLVLQQINRQVFPQPSAVVDNAAQIAAHLQRKQLSGEYRLANMQPYPTLSGALSLTLADNSFWRAISYLPDSISMQQMPSVALAEQTAWAFGHFSYCLRDLDYRGITEVIADFHHLPKRLAALEQAVAQDSYQRLAGCEQWVSLALSQQALLTELSTLLPQLPQRLCHNDTKLNNLLFDRQTMTPLAVVDLDTCMVGPLMYDFGDMVRSGCASHAEDATELAQVEIRADLFAAMANGYCRALAGSLSAVECDSLWLGVRIMPLMLGARFLTDHLLGDGYFPVAHPGHNLQRAANQFTLYTSLLRQQTVLRDCLKRACAE